MATDVKVKAGRRQAPGTERRGIVSATVDNEPEFLVVGGMGVDAWRTGGLGAEIEEALRLKSQGIELKIIP